nr:MHFG family PEP-CTERM protein [uncultured Duganella sp.]
MSLLLAVTLAAAVQPTCSWDHPGRNPYTGGTAAAIDRYTDIPEAVRSTLKRRLEEGQSDDKVSITREHIAGKYQYDSTIRDMHFGRASVCASVTRDKWAENRAEPGAVYCVGEHCILVPRICGNVSRITRTAAAVAQAGNKEGTQSNEGGKHINVPELADLGLMDADNTGLLSDEAEAAARQRALSSLLDMAEALSEEQLAYTDDGLRFSAFGRRGLNGGGDDDGGDGGYVAPQPVPEADTWVMLLAGLGLLGWQARRRTRPAANAAG